MKRFVNDISANKIELNANGKKIVEDIFEIVKNKFKDSESLPWEKSKMFIGGIDSYLNLENISSDTKYHPETGAPILPEHKNIYEIPRKIAIAAMEYTHNL